MENSKLKQIRSELHENQEVFAKRLGITQSYYSAIERGEKAVTAKVLEKLFKDVGVSSQWWYSSTGDMFSSQMSGNSVGVHVGADKKEFDAELFFLRLQNFLKREFPEEHQLLKDIFLLSNFQGFMSNFEKIYLAPLREINSRSFKGKDQGNFSFKAHREEYVKTLQSLSDLKPPIFKLSTAIRQFYSDFQPFDKENLIEDYYEEGE